MNNTYIGTATITPDGQLRLDETLGLPPGRVLVRVETLPQPPAARIHVLDLVEQNGLGRSREDIDAQIAALRDDWPEYGNGTPGSTWPARPRRPSSRLRHP